MRSLLVHASNDGTFESRLQVSLDLARRFDAHLTFLQTIAFDVVIPTDPFTIGGGELSALTKQRAEEFREQVTARLGKEDVRWDWQVESGYDGATMTRHASLNDLAVMGGGTEGVNTPLIGLLAIHCKAPLFVVPQDMQSFDAGGAAVICWNGSTEAARAMRASLPLLTAAAKVHLVAVGSEDDIDNHELPMTSAITYLGRHGVDCEAVTLPRGDEPVPETLRKAAMAREAAFMVMGAYGQPRFFETLFGGVTRSILNDLPVPVLMAH
ncbi:universal stress protein [Aurantiacibacter sp. MUD11]|uniref:universal stress protein n=1 Tax=Aurantiacibacter sp. MUD11 TaxID=3003265 RepID=UPI0022A9FB2E|nr:universal stress protein [Aurantiacibacter sp. MUD11]WAT18842.1 universal stress protein [Aurantiacibacter sp. MUD11]